MSLASASAFLREPRLAACAAAAEPVWLWSVDATQVLWANAAGAALLGSQTVNELTQRRFAPNDRAAAQVARLAASLSAGGAARLERLRGFGTGFMRLLTSTCARISLADGTQGILIIGAETAGQALPLAERARRLFEGSDEDLAVFSPDGALVHATPSARRRMANATTLVAFNASALANEALFAGSATGETLAGTASMVRIGQDASKLLVVRFGALATRGTATSEPAAPALTPEPVAPVEVTAPVELNAPEPSTAPVEVAETVEPAIPASSTPAVEVSAPETATPPKAPEVSAPHAAEAAPAIERQHPLRFVWQMDAEEKFTLASDDFVELIGPVTAQMIGRTWKDISATLQLDPDNQVARAIATRDTWSGIIVNWPVDNSERRLKIELSGLPIYDRQRVFTGYRGFGVCRDIEAFAAIAQDRRTKTARPSAPVAEAPAASESKSPEATTQKAAEPERPALTVVPPVQNVVPFRPVAPATPAAPMAPAAENKTASLNAGERSAFSEIARQLSTRLKTTAPSRDNDQNPAHVLRATPGVGIDGRATPPAEEIPQAAESESELPKAPAWLAQGSDAHALVDKLPLGVLIYRFDTLFYANRAFLDQVGYDTLPAFVEAGGLDGLFIEADGANPNSGSQTLTITTGNGDKVPVEGRLFSIPWNGESALALVFVGVAQPRVQAPVEPPPPQVVRDEADLVRIAQLEAAIAEAKRIAAEAAAERAELLGKITEQVRAPLSSAVGTVDTMLEERFGPIGNERYRAYLADIRGSGMRILGLFEDLASLSKVDSIKAEAKTKADPKLPGVNLNEVVKASVAKMQPEASRVRVLIRTSLSSISLPVTAEPDSLNNIVVNLLTSSIRFAGTGGQVIVSTAPGGAGKVTLRLRDTGAGLSDKELADLQKPAMPGTQPASADASDEKLTMAITRAMLDANNATLAVTSKAEDGTLVEVTFPATAA